MQKFSIHKLDSGRTMGYFADNLKDTNTISSKLLTTLDFSTGQFFTFLPNTADRKQLYAFTSGGILPQNPDQEYVIDSKMVTYSIIPTIQEEIGNFIMQKLRTNRHLSAIFDDILRSPDSPYLEKLRCAEILYKYQKETYYILQNTTISPENLSMCIEKSNAIWHSLCILTTA